MKRLSILLIFVCFSTLLLSQDKNIKSALLNFKNSNFDMVSKNLNAFKAANYDIFLGIKNQKESKNILNKKNYCSYLFLKTNLFFKETPVKNIDSAFIFINKTKKELNDFQSKYPDHYTNYCFVTKFCIDSCSTLENEIEYQVFIKYTMDNDLIMYESFLQKFPSSKNYQKVLVMREDLIIKNALETNDITIIEQSLKEVIDEKKKEETLAIVEKKMIDEAIASQNDSKLIFCKNKFPHSFRLKEIDGVLEDMYIKKAKNENDLKALSAFATKFPLSSRIEEVNLLVENIVTSDALSSRDIEKINSCIAQFPNAVKMTQLKTLLESLEMEDAIYTKDKVKLEYCILKYPNHPSIIYMQELLAKP
jgi:hypothetical protein